MGRSAHDPAATQLGLLAPYPVLPLGGAVPARLREAAGLRQGRGQEALGTPPQPASLPFLRKRGGQRVSGTCLGHCLVNDEELESWLRG